MAVCWKHVRWRWVVSTVSPEVGEKLGQWVWMPTGFSASVGSARTSVFRDYSDLTGHFNNLLQTNFYNVFGPRRAAGDYLAGDLLVGLWICRGRLQQTGITVGALRHPEPTSLPRVFCEGSFDKGILLHLPFERFFCPLPASSRATLAWNPLTRDGGGQAKPFLLAV